MPTDEPMPTFDVWDIVKVPFPYTDRPVRERRPASSVVRTAKIATIEMKEAISIGALPPDDRRAVGEHIVGTLAKVVQ
jgi:hypothetical protein